MAPVCGRAPTEADFPRERNRPQPTATLLAGTSRRRRRPGLPNSATGIQAALAMLNDRLVTFKAGAEVLPGIGTIETPGHTPGHVAFELAGGAGLILAGELDRA